MGHFWATLTNDRLFIFRAVAMVQFFVFWLILAQKLSDPLPRGLAAGPSPYLRRQKVTQRGQPLKFNFVVTAREAQTGLVSQGGTLERIRSWWTYRVT